MAELNEAIAMISYYASSSEPDQVRGKTVYLQYSNRQEITNNKTTADVAGNVLLVTIEGNVARLVSIDVMQHQELFCCEREIITSLLLDSALGLIYYVIRILFDNNVNGSAGSCEGIIYDGSCLHWEKMHVFSAFGFVHKITTFEKTAGFLALIQFSDAETASSAKEALDGRGIPRYLIPELGPCSFRITYSAHTDLSVKFQSHRSRDYTDHLLPVAPSATDTNGQFSLGLDGKKLEPESNVLLASMERMQLRSLWKLCKW
ncbi:RNA processing factor [Lithospermum erythrorhizon]|uniref:RNA processing factor n=1 Tax=Lithospermum erythrorhizon TaxID=34254 RepID=A0AAV3PPL7_LITER